LLLDADEESNNQSRYRAEGWVCGAPFSRRRSVGLRCGLLVRVGIMAGERVTARKRKAGGKVVIKKRTKKFARHQSDQFMRVPVRQPPASFPWQRGAAGGAPTPRRQQREIEQRSRGLHWHGRVFDDIAFGLDPTSPGSHNPELLLQSDDQMPVRPRH